MLIRNLKKLHRRMCCSTVVYNLDPFYTELSKIKKHASRIAGKADRQLRALSDELTAQARNGRALDELLAEAYALVSETIKRVLVLSPFDVQFIGAIAIHQGKMAEMPTGAYKKVSQEKTAFL